MGGGVGRRGGGGGAGGGVDLKKISLSLCPSINQFTTRWLGQSAGRPVPMMDESKSVFTDLEFHNPFLSYCCRRRAVQLQRPVLRGAWHVQ